MSEPTHKHKCWKCGLIWEHPDHCGGVTEAHTCPKCHVEQWDRYRGSEAVSIVTSSCQAPRIADKGAYVQN